MNSAVANVLNKVLGDWLENLNSDQLKLSVLKGKVELKDIKLKSNVLELLGLPFQLEMGIVGRLFVDVPWTSLSSKPLIINVEDVIALISPKPPQNWSEDKEKSNYIVSRAKSLDQFETLHIPELEIKTESGYFQRLVENIVDNVQIHIKNVYLRYEDQTTSKIPFAIGIKLFEASAETCNSNWNPQFIKGESKCYKLVKIDNLSVFLDYNTGVILNKETYGLSAAESLKLLVQNEFKNSIDHKFVLCPLTTNIQIVLYKNSQPDEPRAYIKITQNVLGLQMYFEQLSFIMKLLDLFNIFNNFKAGIDSSFNLREFTDDERTAYKVIYMKWRQENLKSPDSKASIKLKKQLEACENEIKLKSIQFERYIAITELSIDTAILQKTEEINKVKAKGEGTMTKIMNVVTNKPARVLNAEREERNNQIQELEDEIQRLEQIKKNLRSSEPVLSAPISNSIIFIIELNLSQTLLKVYNPDLLISTELRDFYFKYGLNQSSSNIEISFESLVVKDHTSLTDLLPYLIESKSAHVLFGTNRLKIDTTGMNIILNLKNLLSLIDQLKASLSQQIDLQAFISAASAQTQNYVNSGAQYFNKIIKEGAPVTLDINLVAPVVYIPSPSSTSFLIMDLGKIKLNSSEKKTAKSAYDCFNMVFSDMEIITVWSMKSLKNWTEYDKIIYHSDASLVMKMYKGTLKTGFNVFVDLGSSKLKVSDNQLLFLLDIASMFVSYTSKPLQVPDPVQNPQPLSEKVLEIQESIPWKLKTICKDFEIDLISKKVEIVNFNIYTLQVNIIMNKLQDMQIMVQTQNFSITNPRCEVFKYILQKSTPTESLSGPLQFKMMMNMLASKGIMEILLSLSQVFIVINLDFIFEILNFTNKVLEKLPGVNKASKTPVLYSINTTRSHYSIRLMGIDVWAPLSVSDPSTKILRASTAVSLVYSSLLVSKTLYDINDIRIKTETLNIDEEAAVTVSHFTINITDKDQVSEFRNILNPSRLTLDYFNFAVPGSVDMKVNVRVESLVFYVGFYDIDFLRALVFKFTALAPAAQEPKSQENTSKMTFNFDGDSLQMDLCDDNNKKVLSIVHAQLSNVSALIVLDPKSTYIDFSSIFCSNCFNRTLRDWEPLIEDWKLDVNINQEGSLKPFIVTLKSDHFLNINLNLSIAQEIALIASKMTKPLDPKLYITEQEHEIDRIDFSYKLFNHLDQTIRTKINLPGNKKYWKIDNGDMVEFKQSFITKLQSANTPKSKFKFSNHLNNALTTLTLEVTGFDTFNGIIIEEVSFNVFFLKSFDKIVGFAVEVTSLDSIITINILSSVQVCNNTSFSLTFVYFDVIFELKEGKSIPLALNIAEDLDNLYILSTPRENLSATKYLNINNKYYVVEMYSYSTDSDSVYKSIEINPTLIIKNLLPGEMTLITEGKPVCKLETGKELSIDAVDTTKDLEFAVELKTNQMVFYTLLTKYKETSCELPFTSDPKSSIKIETSANDMRKNSVPNLNARNKTKIGLRGITSKLLVFYAEFIILNKTGLNLNFSKMKLPSNSWRLFNGSTGKVKLNDFPTKYSQPFGLKNVSLSGLLTIKYLKEPLEANLGVSISAAEESLPKTNIISIVPRYMVSNLLKCTIFIRKINDKNSCMLNPNDVLPFEPNKSKAAIQISLNDQDWTGGFAIDNIEDFQIRLKKDKEDIKSTTWDVKQWRKGDKKYIRVMIYTKDEATIHISFFKPEDPEYLITNKTNQEVIATQKDYNGFVLVIKPNTSAPWAFDNFIVPEKRILLSVPGYKRDYSIEKIKKCKKLGDLLVSVVVQGVTRQMIIESNERLSNVSENSEKNYIFTNKLLGSFPGIGISIMDYRNSEKLYMSLSEINLKFKITKQQFENKAENIIKIDMTLGNLQIDNMDAKQVLYPVLLCKYRTESDLDDQTPFFQFKVHKESIVYSIQEPSIDKIKWLEVCLQPFELKINEEIIYVLISIVKEITKAFTAEIEPKPLELDSSFPTLPYKLNEIQRKSYFEFLRICAMKFQITFRKSSKSTGTNLISELNVIGVLGSILKGFTNISDSPISFKEVMVTHGFQTIPNLTSVFAKNYIRQAIFQVYKVLGSSDMIGNPLGLIDKLGTGVFEFVTEPARGLLKGPKAFASGVSKGVKSLVGSIFAGSFGSVSKITGSLYGVIKDISGESVDVRGDYNGVSMSEGFKGGIMDVANGITGIFTKPYKGAKEQGAKGFFKGIGSGLFGLVSSPVKLVLKFGTTITGEIANSANLLAKGKVQTFGRVRFPRHLGRKRILEPYDSELAQAQQLLEKEDSSQRILYYTSYNEEKNVIIIITNQFFWYLIDAETEAKMLIGDIQGLDIHMHEGVFLLSIGNSVSRISIKSYSFGKLATVYYSLVSFTGKTNYLENNPESDKSSNRVCC